MLARLPISDPEQLVLLERIDSAGNRHPLFTVPEYEALRSFSRQQLGVITRASITRAEIGGESIDRLSFLAVEGGLFPMLGAGVAAGRLLTPGDERDAAPVAV